MQSRAKTYAAVMVQAFEGLSEKEAVKKARSFKRLLYKRGDAKYASGILLEFAKAWKERKGKTATAVTAQSLADKTKTEMEKSLERQGYILEKRLDPGVIGGTALYLGNEYVIDNTVRGKLQRMAKLLHG